MFFAFTHTTAGTAVLSCVTLTSEYASELTRHLLFAHQDFPEVMKYD